MCVSDEEKLLYLQLLLVGDYANSTSAWGWSHDEAVLAVVPLCREDDVGCFRHSTHGLDCPCVVALECCFVLVINLIILVFLHILVLTLCEPSNHNLISDVVLGDRDLFLQITVEVVCVLGEADRALWDVHVQPIIFSQFSYFLALAVAWEINNFGRGVMDTILILNHIDFWLVVHHKQTLHHLFFDVIADVLAISFESYELAARQSPNLIFDNWICFCLVEL